MSEKWCWEQTWDWHWTIAVDLRWVLYVLRLLSSTHHWSNMPALSFLPRWSWHSLQMQRWWSTQSQAWNGKRYKLKYWCRTRDEPVAIQSVFKLIVIFTCNPEGPDAPLKPLCPSSPFAPFMPCCPRGPGSPSAPWNIHRQVTTASTAQPKLPNYTKIYFIWCPMSFRNIPSVQAGPQVLDFQQVLVVPRKAERQFNAHSLEERHD